jgi:hypothetical protein
VVIVISDWVVAAAFYSQPLPAAATRFAADGRAERIGLDSYERKARCEGAFPFDYLTR